MNYARIEKAYKRIANIIHHTPMTYAPVLSAMTGYEIYLKKENLQMTGSFKLRGSFNKIASLVEEGYQGGVVAASAGNHAQGVAFAAKHFGIPATIVMPDSAPLTKVIGAEKLGAHVILHGCNYDEAYAYALNYTQVNDAYFIHPFADNDVIAGQGTLALEMLNDIPDLDAIVVSVGGGGLISGVAIAAQQINPTIQVIGVAAAGASAMKNSFDAKKALDSNTVRTIADGIAVRKVSSVTLDYILDHVAALELVDDDEIATAILFLLEKQKLLVEGAGAAGVAALLHNRLDIPKGSKIGVVISGGNIDVTMLALIIEKGLVKSARKMKLKVTLVDKPGTLYKLTEKLTELDANIVQIGYDRTSIDLAFGDAHISVDVETKDADHQHRIRQELLGSGFSFIEQSFNPHIHNSVIKNKCYASIERQLAYETLLTSD